MRSKSRSRETDFRPFFDLIVGVLFIFLILISAQMFFMRHETMESQDSAAQKLEQARKEQIQSFLDSVVEQLQKRKLAAELDLTRTELRLPLDQLSQPSSGAVPKFLDAPLAAVGEVLSRHVSCLEAARGNDTTCGNWSLLKLNDVHLDVQTGEKPSASALPSARFGQLASTIFTSTLLSAQPELLGMTGTGGLPLFQFGYLPSDLKAAASANLLRIRFSFRQ